MRDFSVTFPFNIPSDPGSFDFRRKIFTLDLALSSLGCLIGWGLTWLSSTESALGIQVSIWGYLLSACISYWLSRQGHFPLAVALSVVSGLLATVYASCYYGEAVHLHFLLIGLGFTSFIYLIDQFWLALGLFAICLFAYFALFWFDFGGIAGVDPPSDLADIARKVDLFIFPISFYKPLIVTIFYLLSQISSSQKYHQTRDLLDQSKLLNHELQQIHLTLEEKNRQLKSYINSNMELENFAYIASHDLKEPIRSISGFAQLLLNKYEDKLDENGQEYLQYLVSAARSMNFLITDLLELARVQNDSSKVQSLETEALLQQVVERLHHSIAESAAKISWSPLPQAIVGNPVQLHQLIQNLISNAIKFRNPDITPEIWIKVEDLGTHWEFAVADNGIGIESVYFEKIFSLFKKLHSKQIYEGTGIGLALCKKIVELHGGEIWVSSAPGFGTTFYFTLKKEGRPGYELN